MPTRINILLQSVPSNALLFLNDMERLGISRYLVQDYLESGWLSRIGPGAYRLSDAKPDIYSIVSAFQRNEKLDITVGASSALELQGFSHYITMGKQQVYLLINRGKNIPGWVKSYDGNVDIREFSSSVLPPVGFEIIEHNGQQITVSSPERAIMECILLTPKQFALMDVMYLMEMLTTLRPKVVEALLKECTSVKVNRLFLYMAEKARHGWLKRVDLSGVDLGTGTRSFAKGGVTIPKYNIVVPKELADYE